MFSKSFFACLILVILLPLVAFGQQYTSEKCHKGSHTPWELTITTSHNSSTFDISGKYTHPQYIPLYPWRRCSGVLLPEVIDHGDGETWAFGSELLIPVNWGHMSHVITAVQYASMSSDFLYAHHTLDQEDFTVTFGVKFKF